RYQHQDELDRLQAAIEQADDMLEVYRSSGEVPEDFEAPPITDDAAYKEAEKSLAAARAVLEKYMGDGTLDDSFIGVFGPEETPVEIARFLARLVRDEERKFTTAGGVIPEDLESTLENRAYDLRNELETLEQQIEAEIDAFVESDLD